MASPSPQRRIILTTVLLALTAVLVTMLPKWFKEPPGQSPHISQSQCDIGQQPCTAPLADNRSVGLHIQAVNSSQIKSLTPLTFTARLPDGLKQVTLELTGREMYMGINRIAMQRIANTDDQWQAQTELAVCTTGSMVWQARLISADSATPTLATFEFEAH